MLLMLKAIFLGVVQGLTEFLPVSSSGHLVIFHDILNFNLKQNLAFDVSLHLGTLLALIIYFRQDLLHYLQVIWQLFRREEKVAEDDVNIILALLYATIPAVILGLIFDRVIELYLHSVWVVFFALLVGAGILWFVESKSRPRREIENLNLPRALLVGLAQASALLPGLSRSGMTIAAGMSLGLTRAAAARFSFLLGIPIIAGAGFFKIMRMEAHLLSGFESAMFIVGFVFSALSGWLVIKFLLQYLREHTLNAFVVYRLFLAGALLLYILLAA